MSLGALRAGNVGQIGEFEISLMVFSSTYKGRVHENGGTGGGLPTPPDPLKIQGGGVLSPPPDPSPKTGGRAPTLPPTQKPLPQNRVALGCIRVRWGALGCVKVR